MSLITLEPDMNIEPGHQWLVLENGVQDGIDGFFLAALLNDVAPEDWRFVDNKIRIAHTAEVDRRILKLIDELAHVRFSAPNLVQMTMIQAVQESAA